MKELVQLYNEMESFEKDIEKDQSFDTTLVRMAFQLYIDNRFDQIARSDTPLFES